MAQAVVDYVTAVNEGYAAIGASVDAVVGDVNKLNAIILALENSPDRVTPADQQLITDSLAVLSGLKAKAQALDDMTAAPPVDPPIDPPIDPPPPPIDPNARRR